MTFRTRFKFPRVKTVVAGECLTRQEFKDEADINNIVKRYQATGVLVDPLKVDRRRVPQYFDASDVPDLQTAYALIDDARERFASLPGKVREMFASDPIQFVGWITDPANKARAVELGLIANRSQDVSTSPPEPATPKAKEKPALAKEGDGDDE